MWHWILDVIGAVILIMLGRFFGWQSGWKHGYREGWSEESQGKRNAKGTTRPVD